MQTNASSENEYTGVLNEDDAETNDGGLNKNVVDLKYANEWNMKLIWGRIISIALFHLGAIYGLYLLITSAKIHTAIFGNFKHIKLVEISA